MKFFLFFLLVPMCLFGSTKVSIIGDSISLGGGVNPGECYIDLLRERYKSEGKDVEIINRSYNGATTKTGEMITVQLITMDKPDYFVTFLGINDVGFNVPEDQLRKNLSAIFEKAKHNCKAMIIGGVNSEFVNPSYNMILGRTYQYIIDTYQVNPVMLLGIDVLLTAPDRVHPNKIGHQIMAQYLYEALKNCGLN